MYQGNSFSEDIAASIEELKRLREAPHTLQIPQGSKRLEVFAASSEVECDESSNFESTAEISDSLDEDSYADSEAFCCHRSDPSLGKLPRPKRGRRNRGVEQGMAEAGVTKRRKVIDSSRECAVTRQGKRQGYDRELGKSSSDSDTDLENLVDKDDTNEDTILSGIPYPEIVKEWQMFKGDRPLKRANFRDMHYCPPFTRMICRLALTNRTCKKLDLKEGSLPLYQ